MNEPVDLVWAVVEQYVHDIRGVATYRIRSVLMVSVDPMRDGNAVSGGRLSLEDGDLVWASSYALGAPGVPYSDGRVALADPDCFVVLRRWIEEAMSKAGDQMMRRTEKARRR